MKRLALVLVGGALLTGLATGPLVSRVMSSGPQRGQPAEPTPPAAAPSERPSTATLPKGLVTLRIQFAGKAQQEAQEAAISWDGQLSVQQGRLHGLRLWQEDPRDRVEGNQWKLAAGRPTPGTAAELKKGHEPPPPPSAGLVVELTDVTPETRLAVKTVRGDFDFALKDVAPGAAPKLFLGGMVEVSLVANAGIILSAPSEDDFPAAALGPDGKLYVAYVAFTHGKDFRVREALDEVPQSLDNLAEPTGGDQVLLLCLDGRQWTDPLPVTHPGQDVFRPAIAVDGSRKAWIFWSGKSKGAWNLYARCLDAGRWSEIMQLTSQSEPDVFPAAATDSSGRVWVAWQAFRGDRASILALRQEGNGFSAPIVVAEGKANAWTPAIAASAGGQLAIAWDTYAKGDYDVYCRIWSGGQFGKTIPIATSLEAEMRPSVTYDGAGRLWIAYEKSPEHWGKDWGGLVKKGVPLYRGRSIAVRIWADGKLWQPAEDPAAAMAPARIGGPRTGLMAFTGGQWQDIYGDPATSGPRLALPRLTTDAAGRVWLAVRSPALGTRAPVGSSWFEHLAWYEGKRWSAQIVCPRTDNILDNRPALVARPTGEIVLIAASDARSAASGTPRPAAARAAKAKGAPAEAEKPKSRWPDPVNNELVMAETGPAPGSGQVRVELEPVSLVEPGQPAPEAVQEATDVARARSARVTIGPKTLRLARGEFHRHTEISPDGANDGMLMDMWRYALDAAGLDWVGNGDHDNGNGREYSWWIVQKTTDLFGVPGVFAPMYTYERSCVYPDGHRNVVFAKRGVRTLPRLKGGAGKALDELPPEAQRPSSPDTQLLYRYLAQFDGVCASHTSGTNMGTDWRDNNRKVEPIVEIYQGCRQNYEMPDAPRANTAEYSIGGWRPLGFVSLALKKGYRLGFQSSSDHVSTHISLCNCWVEELSREGILAAMKARHVYGSTDNIVAEYRCGEHFMGDEFTLPTKPTLKVRLVGTAPMAKVHVIKDGNYVHTLQPKKQEVEFEWTDLDVKPGATSYYYVRGEQEDGELVWLSPMWITYKP